MYDDFKGFLLYRKSHWREGSWLVETPEKKRAYSIYLFSSLFAWKQKY